MAASGKAVLSTVAVVALVAFLTALIASSMPYACTTHSSKHVVVAPKIPLEGSASSSTGKPTPSGNCSAPSNITQATPEPTSLDGNFTFINVEVPLLGLLVSSIKALLSSLPSLPSIPELGEVEARLMHLAGGGPPLGLVYPLLASLIALTVAIAALRLRRPLTLHRPPTSTGLALEHAESSRGEVRLSPVDRLLDEGRIREAVIEAFRDVARLSLSRGLAREFYTHRELSSALEARGMPSSVRTLARLFERARFALVEPEVDPDTLLKAYNELVSALLGYSG